MKTLVLVILGCIILASVMSILDITDAELLPIGSSLPQIKYNYNGVLNMVQKENGVRTIIMVFNTHCAHCQYELDVLENSISKFTGRVLYLLTSDNEIENHILINRWRKLFCDTRNNIHWGFIDKDQYRSIFGQVMTPSFFIYDDKHILIYKIFGETKIDRLLQ